MKKRSETVVMYALSVKNKQAKKVSQGKKNFRQISKRWRYEEEINYDDLLQKERTQDYKRTNCC